MSDTLYEEHGLAAGKVPDAPVVVDSGQFLFFIGLTLDAIFFLTFAGGYYALRSGALAWPPADLPHLDRGLVGSSMGFVAAAAVLLMITVFAQNRNALRTMRASLVLAMLCLAGFLCCNAVEWHSLIASGLLIRTVFGGIYFVLTGTYHLHIIGALVYILSKYRWTLRWRRYTRSAASISHLAYFMDVMLLVWAGIYYAVYF